MQRLAPLALERLPASLRKQLETARELMGFIPNDGLTMARSPGMVEAFLALVQSVFGPGEVDPVTKRLVGLIASAAAGCEYCVGHTANSFARLGGEATKLAAVWEFETSPLFTAAERSALRVALGAGQSPNAVSDAEYADFAAHYSEAQQIEVVAVISMFGFLNRWNSTFKTQLEDDPQQALDKLPQR